MKYLIFKFIPAILLGLITILPASAQLSSSFELRYYSKDKLAIGITDFSGEKAIFSTEDRIEFLDNYAEVAARIFLDSALDSKVNTFSEVERFLSELKSQPYPVHRRRIPLEQWKVYGYNPLNRSSAAEKINHWNTQEDAIIQNGMLNFLKTNVKITLQLDSLQWRFHLRWRARSISGKLPMTISLTSGGRKILETGFHSNGNIFFTERGADRQGETYIPGKWYDFKLEVDLVNDRYNLLIDGRKTADWISLNPTSLIDALTITAGDGIVLDEFIGLKFDTTGCSLRYPYTIEPFIEETFDTIPSISGWESSDFDDGTWKDGKLPYVKGGVLEEGEDLYLRKKIQLGGLEKAWLNVETLDPGGEIWINGQIVYVTHNRHPIRIEVSEFLKPYSENIIAIRVFSFRNEEALYHSPLDRNIGWFCGRAWLDLTGSTSISDTRIHTKTLLKATDRAEMTHQLILRNERDSTFNGKVIIDYYPWYPVEASSKAGTFEKPVTIFARDTLHLQMSGWIERPKTWSHDQPRLYRIHIKLEENQKFVDDVMVTTGIRTVSQEGGIFRINGEPELMGGAQTMGFRMPVENIAKWNRCPPSEILADELIACKKLGNALRIHVHAGGTYAYSVNDPRVAEMADQLGLMLIWPTTAWIREGEWGGIDFEGYPKYMKQVYNHPSIVMWEGANHPNRFEGKPLSYTNRFITKIVRTMLTVDSSRLISPTSYNRHFMYRNDAGTIDKDGNSIIPSKEWTHPLVVRGNQDAITGYGAKWHNIRKWPDPYRKSLLDSPDRAYFNFEHEESIGMQNFKLARGMPWYEMPSYENNYDVGSIGREFAFEEWRTSQAWQAFSAWESMKWQRIQDIDGFSWCCLHGGPNSGTYRKPLIDALGHAKLSYYINKIALQDVVAGSDNPDVVYHRKDELTPVILSVGRSRNVKLRIVIRNLDGDVVDTRTFENVLLEEGRKVTKIPSFRPKFAEEGYYVFEYFVLGV